MKKILITGATGSVGLAVIHAFNQLNHTYTLHAGVRNLITDADKFKGRNVVPVEFDFTNSATYKAALQQCDILFLLRPPQIADVAKYFKPLIDVCKATDVKHIVFLSVQGVENSKIIPHHKIEKLILESKIPYTFLRPAYFMQNFTTTLRKDLKEKKCIFLPAGNAKFTLIDVRDIGSIAAAILTNTASHINRAYDLTNDEKLTFAEMASIMSRILEINIQFISPNLLRFFFTKRKENTPVMFILVMIMLHYFPRFQKDPETTRWVEQITKRKPMTFEGFVRDHQKLLVA